MRSWRRSIGSQGNTAVVCGTGGAPCQDCSQSGKVCRAGSCGPCEKSTECAGETVCLKDPWDAPTGTCVDAWNREWYILVVSGAINCTSVWDITSGPDPFVNIHVGTSVSYTKTVALLIWALWPGREPPGEPRPPRPAGFSVVSGAVDCEQGRLRCRTTGCTLEAPEIETRLELARHCVVTRRRGRIRLVRGQLTVEVRPRPAKQAVRIAVSHGVVEVTGTRFTLRQDPRGGWVELERGAIRFVSDDGRAVALRPGERLDWPLPPPEPPASQPSLP